MSLDVPSSEPGGNAQPRGLSVRPQLSALWGTDMQLCGRLLALLHRLVVAGLGSAVGKRAGVGEGGIELGGRGMEGDGAPQSKGVEQQPAQRETIPAPGPG